LNKGAFYKNAPYNTNDEKIFVLYQKEQQHQANYQGVAL
jgi:hypothetical protein